MVLEIVLDNITNYVFGTRILTGVFILLSLVIGGISARIDKMGFILLLAPIVLVMGQYGYLPSVMSVVIFIGIFILWGIMFKFILGKKY